MTASSSDNSLIQNVTGVGVIKVNWDTNLTHSFASSQAQTNEDRR